MGNSHLEYAKGKKNSYELWSSLCNVFERNGIVSQLSIRKSLLTMKFDSTNDTLANHFLKFDNSIRDLRSTGATLEEIDIVCHLLLTMPNEYEVVVTALETLLKEDLMLNFKTEDTIQISVAKSGTHIEANKVGDIDIVSEVNEKEYFIKVKDVLSVSGLNHNLLSEQKMEIEEKNDKEVEENQESEERIFENIDLSEMCVKMEKTKYIKESLDLGLWFKTGEKESLLCYADADFGSEYDRKLTGGFSMKGFSNTVHWATKRQTSVALSSPESMAVSDLLWLKKLLEHFGISLLIPLKHVDVKYKFVRDLTGKGVVDLKYICTSEQLADILIKPLSSEQFLKLCLSLGLIKVEGVDTVDNNNIICWTVVMKM
ncbi:hypothetical protein ILUMI_17382 [Ignelater luminosus]|uniref:Retrovirus-related Pol polyprotein from transposon TNT 1-94 n=1 Tax=Ignelater luminosus TaxID=2038154 RepID=A0A8K0CPI0_IGNLU|nr:hypothetical protein ILUMI_17382 [Ignelater luminosus]